MNLTNLGDAIDDSWEIEAGVVRPYLLTQGRTHAGAGDAVLAVEAIVETTPLGAQGTEGLAPEYRNIIDLCRSRQSVAEVAARLHTPLGVTRVLIVDLADEGMVRVATGLPADLVADVELLQRLITRIKAIPV